MVSKTEDKRERLLEVAEKLFAQQGYEGTSTRQIASAAGMNIAMISYYFGSKDGLYLHMVEERVAFVRENLIRINKEEPDLWKRLDLFIEFYSENFLLRPYVHRIIYRELSISQREDLQETFAKMIRTATSEIMKFFKQGVNSGVFREIDIPFTMATMIGTIFQMINTPVIVTKILGEKGVGKDGTYSPEHRERLARHLKELLRNHLKPTEQ